MLLLSADRGCAGPFTLCTSSPDAGVPCQSMHLDSHHPSTWGRVANDPRGYREGKPPLITDVVDNDPPLPITRKEKETKSQGDLGETLLEQQSEIGISAESHPLVEDEDGVEREE